ncbi:MAG: exo-alpha-sialidase [Planctomycetes bacterium]|nr:exo-alpha-sialidase [Planctomycetota bacterium]
MARRRSHRFGLPAGRVTAVLCVAISLACAQEPHDPRDVAGGLPIPDEGYCDQPRIVVLADGTWVCVLTTGPGHEGQAGQHVVATRSADQGRTWSPLVDVEPSDPERPASYAVSFATSFDRVYAFYTYNGDAVWARPGRDERIRADTHGWWCYRFSDDAGATWSERRRIPMRVTACDRDNDWGGTVQMFWAIGDPVRTTDGAVVFGFTKLRRYFLQDGEGWFWRSDNLDTEHDPDALRFELLPDGDHGLRNDAFGSVQEEFNVVPMSDGGLACVFRTTLGFPAISYSRDGGHTWTAPAAMRFAPGGRVIRNPRACPKIWRTRAGHYLFWFHHHGGTDFHGRNPAWLIGGIERDDALVWSQPEICLYGADRSYATGRFSYPDLIEDGERWFVAETQKTVARVHEVDGALLFGMWAQVDPRLAASTPGDALDVAAGEPLPELPELALGGGFSIAATVEAEGPLVDGPGLSLWVAERTLHVRVDDGTRELAWSSDPLPDGRRHRIVVTFDGGPTVATVVVDGLLDDGGDARARGFEWFDAGLGAPGPATARVPLRVFTRPLRTAEAVALGGG